MRSSDMHQYQRISQIINTSKFHSKNKIKTMKIFILFALVAFALAAPYPRSNPEAFFNIFDINPTYIFRPSPLSPYSPGSPGFTGYAGRAGGKAPSFDTIFPTTFIQTYPE